MKINIFFLISLSSYGLNWAQGGTGFLFRKEIIGLAFPYYKLRLSMGECMNQLAFKEVKAYPGLKLNRLLDIYYKSDDANQKVSKVDITLITNNTNCIAFSNIGLGHHEFRGTVVIPNSIALFIYTLEVYVCWNNTTDDVINITTEPPTEPTTYETFTETEGPTMAPRPVYKPWKPNLLSNSNPDIFM